MGFSKITFIAKIAIDFLSHPHLPVTHYSHIHHTSICVCYDHGLYKIYFVILYKPTPQIYIFLTLDFMGSCVWVESNNFCPLHHRTTTKNTQASSMCNEKGKNKKKGISVNPQNGRQKLCLKINSMAISCESILTIRFCFYVDKGLMITNNERIGQFEQPLRIDQHISCIFKRFEHFPLILIF